jgi:single-strand DNA-binding protein
MPNYAHTTIIGHLGQDPEVRFTQSGTPVASCSVATSRKRGQEETTTWWRVSLFGKRAEVLAQYLNKGDPVLFSGEPYLRPWTDKAGNERVSLELAASDFAFIGGGQRQQAPQQQAPQQDHRPVQFSPVPYDDDIPF